MAHKRWEPWKDEELAKIAELYRQGWTTMQIADEMGVMSDRLRQVVKRHGMSGFLEPRRSWTTKQETELINDFENGMRTARAVYSRIQILLDRGYDPVTNRTVEKRKRRCKNENKVRRGRFFTSQST